MNDKVNNNSLIHQLPAGLIKGDTRTELFGCRDTKKVFAVSNGETKSFNEISPAMKASIFEQMLNDDVAMNDLRHLPHDEALEQYAFCLFGDANHEPDFCEKGNIQKADNFMCSDNCKCLNWKSKNITVDDKPLTNYQIRIVKMMATDLPDKSIATYLNISQSTLDYHKSKIFEKFNVESSKGLIRKAIAEKIIQ